MFVRVASKSLVFLDILENPMAPSQGPPLSVVMHKDNLRRQAEEHWLIEDRDFVSVEDYVLHLMHCRAYVKASELIKGRHVLDWGCNTGYGIEFMLQNAGDVSGLDLSDRAVAAARKRFAGRGVDIQLFDGKRCSFPSAGFDVVTSFQVLEHVSEYSEYFLEILRVLRPGGIAIFTTPNAAARLDPGMKPWNRFHVHEFHAEELRTFLGKWFEKVEIFGLFGSDTMMKIERGRVDVNKRRARRRFHWWKIRSALISTIKAILPHRLTLSLRSRFKGKIEIQQKPIASRTQRRLQPKEMQNYRVEDLYYRETGLDDALDLMAICTKPAKSNLS